MSELATDTDPTGEPLGRVRIGLAGIGDIGRIHAASLSRLTGVELVIAAGRSPERARDLAAELGATCVASYRDLLADPTVDGVDLCVPNDLHAEYAASALEAGKHVLCEKPITLDLESAERITTLAAAAGKSIMVGHTLRYWPCYVVGHREITDGRIGVVSSFSARRMLSLLRATTGAEGWRHQGARSGGAVIDLQVHDLDFVLWTFGRPRSVFSRGVRSETGAYDHVWTILDYANGPTVGVESSFMLQGNPVTMDFRAIGERGSLEFSFVESDFDMHQIRAASEGDRVNSGGELKLYRWGEPTQVLGQDPADPITAAFEAELAAFVGLLRGDPQADVAPTRDAIEALEVALASYRSCETGETILLD